MATNTLSSRQLRALHALLAGPVTRENLDKIAKQSNGPDLIYNFRKMGAEMPCERVKKVDSDGAVCYPGIYHLTADDCILVNKWLGGK